MVKVDHRQQLLYSHSGRGIRLKMTEMTKAISGHHHPEPKIFPPFPFTDVRWASSNNRGKNVETKVCRKNCNTLRFVHIVWVSLQKRPPPPQNQKSDIRIPQIGREKMLEQMLAESNAVITAQLLDVVLLSIPPP